MNNFERRFYSEPEIKSVPVMHLSSMKEIFQKILRDIEEQNPYATVSEILTEDIEEETKYD